MSEWPFPGLPASQPKELPWEAVRRNSDGEWEIIDAFENEEEARDFAAHFPTYEWQIERHP